jgi:hypothetical protein
MIDKVLIFGRGIVSNNRGPIPSLRFLHPNHIGRKHVVQDRVKLRTKFTAMKKSIEEYTDAGPGKSAAKNRRYDYNCGRHDGMYGNTARTSDGWSSSARVIPVLGCTGGNREICAIIAVFDLLWALKHSPDLIGFSPPKIIFRLVGTAATVTLGQAQFRPAGGCGWAARHID